MSDQLTELFAEVLKMDVSGIDHENTHENIEEMDARIRIHRRFCDTNKKSNNSSYIPTFRDVIEEFASRFPGESRRGLGFDMKQMDPGRSMNMANSASSKAFGHLGFTGTSIWIDPAEELVFIFLSNRTYPSMRNNKLSRDSYRTRMQEVAYRSITRSAIMPPPVEPIPTGDLPAHIESARRP